MSEPITNKPKNEYKYEYTFKERFDDVVEFITNIPWEIKWRICTFYHNVRRLCSWIPIIWTDRDWDSCYLLIIIRHKLQTIHENSKDWNWVGSEKATEQLQQAIKDIDTILDDDPYSLTKEEHKQFVDKYGQLVTWGTPSNDQLIEMHFAYSKCDTQQLADQADKQSIAIDKLQQQRFKETNDRLFNNIRDNHLGWWD